MSAPDRGQCCQLTGEEILRLSDIHPEAGEIIRVKLVVGCDGGEDFLLYRCRL